MLKVHGWNFRARIASLSLILVGCLVSEADAAPAKSYKYFGCKEILEAGPGSDQNPLAEIGASLDASVKFTGVASCCEKKDPTTGEDIDLAAWSQSPDRKSRISRCTNPDETWVAQPTGCPASAGKDPKFSVLWTCVKKKASSPPQAAAAPKDSDIKITCASVSQSGLAAVKNQWETSKKPMPFPISVDSTVAMQEWAADKVVPMPSCKGNAVCVKTAICTAEVESQKAVVHLPAQFSCPAEKQPLADGKFEMVCPDANGCFELSKNREMWVRKSLSLAEDAGVKTPANPNGAGVLE